MPEAPGAEHTDASLAPPPAGDASGAAAGGRRSALTSTALVLAAGLLPLALAPVRARYLGPAGRGEFA